MSSIFGGGTSKASVKSQEAVKQDNTQRQQFFEKMAGQARDDVLDLIPRGQEAAQRGYANSLQMLGQSMAPRMDVVGQGNINAQGTIAGAAPQFQNAILGAPVDYSFAQPKQANVDMSFVNDILQQFQAQNAAQNEATQQQNTGMQGVTPTVAAGNLSSIQNYLSQFMDTPQPDSRAQVLLDQQQMQYDGNAGPVAHIAPPPPAPRLLSSIAAQQPAPVQYTAPASFQEYTAPAPAPAPVQYSQPIQQYTQPAPAPAPAPISYSQPTTLGGFQPASFGFGDVNARLY